MGHDSLHNRRVERGVAPHQHRPGRCIAPPNLQKLWSLRDRSSILNGLSAMKDSEQVTTGRDYTSSVSMHL
jgi:hypothetical protein